MSVKRFVTRRVEIEALQFTGDNWLELVEWTQSQFRARGESNYVELASGTTTAEVYDKLHDTWVGVVPGQWIVRGAKGEYYPCDNETFHWKYEEVVTEKSALDEKMRSHSWEEK